MLDTTGLPRGSAVRCNIVAIYSLVGVSFHIYGFITPFLFAKAWLDTFLATLFNF